MRQDSNPVRACQHCGRKINGNYILVGLSVACPYCRRIQEGEVKK